MNRFKDSNFIQQLLDLRLPSINSPSSDWLNVASVLNTCREEFRKISGLYLLSITTEDYKKIPLSKEGGSILENYDKACHLLLDCLNLAKVTDHKAILNQLFMPVEEKTT